MTLLSALNTRVYVPLRDSEKAFVATGSVDQWLNDAYLDLAARLKLFRKQVTGTTSATGTITLPVDYIEPTWLSVLAASTDDAQTVVEFVEDSVFDSWRLNDSTPDAQLGRIFGGTIETWPVVVSLAYTLRYVYSPAVLGSSDTVLIPSELHVKMVNYATAQAKYQEGELEEADRYLSLYNSGLPISPNTQRRERPGPFNMIPQPTYWDMDTP